MSDFYRSRRFWFSLRRASGCTFSRRNGYYGTKILGWSVCLRLFGKDVL